MFSPFIVLFLSHFFCRWPISETAHFFVSVARAEKDSIIYDAKKIEKYRTFVYHHAASFERINNKYREPKNGGIKILFCV